MSSKKKKTTDLDMQAPVDTAPESAMQAPQEVQEQAYDAFMVEAEFNRKYSWISKGNVADTLLCILKELVAIRMGEK